METPEDLAAELACVVNRLARELVYRNPATLAVGDMAVLAAVADGIVSPGEIARMERIAGPSLTKHLRTLSERGLLDRAAHGEDARRAVLALTDAGRAELAAARSGSWLASSVRELAPDDAKTLATAIPVLRLLGADAPSAATPAEGSGGLPPAGPAG